MSPFFAILFSLVLLKERANVWQYLSVLAAFGGAMLIIKPGFSADTFPAVIGLLGGMSAGAAYTFVRALSKRNEKSARIVFFFSAFSILTSLPFVIADFHPMTFAQFMCLMGAGAAATAVNAALRKQGSPYVWGAKGPDRFDCSGLVQWSYEQAGVSLPASTRSQVSVGRKVSESDLRPGDVIFYYGSASHDAIYIGGGKVVHAPTEGQTVTTEEMDYMGDINTIRRFG